MQDLMRIANTLPTHEQRAVVAVAGFAECIG